MFKRISSVLGIFIVLFALGACSNKKVKNPIASVDSKQPDKILFDRAMQAMKAGKYDVARLTLQTMINTYPDSEYVARAKLAVGDSWYAEGGAAAMTQAENEYKDFITFFPNMPEAAEAQLKIANIHYREMEKPDRDFTHALRAEEEYRTLITQFPESKLVPEARARLRQVQEVLAEREFLVAHYYFMRESYNAAVARFRTLIDAYPLFSGTDEALYELGECYQKQAENLRASRLPEQQKARLVKERNDLAAAAFSKIITEYPATDRMEDAKKTLAEMHYPVPTPTAQAIAESKKIEESRGDPGFRDKLMSFLHRGPTESLDRASKVGDPTLTDPKQVSAVALMQQFEAEVKAAGGGSKTDNKVAVEADTGNPNALPATTSDAGSNTTGAEIVSSPPAGSNPPPAAKLPAGSNPPVDPNGIPELTPITDNSKQAEPAKPPTPPTQINEAQTGDSSSASTSGSSASSTDTKADANQSPADYSTSKHKKKKGLHKLIPF
jgi:outer membrane protein assembly factor BamD